MRLVDRTSSCILGRAVEQQRSGQVLQAVVDQAPQMAFDFSDLYPAYRSLLYIPGLYTLMPDKSETYRVEGVNAELRHYLTRLARNFALLLALHPCPAPSSQVVCLYLESPSVVSFALSPLSHSPD
jgi:IS1 family transposase